VNTNGLDKTGTPEQAENSAIEARPRADDLDAEAGDIEYEAG